MVIGLIIHSRRQNILSIYNGPQGLARGKGRKTVSRAGAGRLGQLSLPDVSPPVRHLRAPIILTLPLVPNMQRNPGEKEGRNVQYNNKQQQRRKNSGTQYFRMPC